MPPRTAQLPIWMQEILITNYSELPENLQTQFKNLLEELLAHKKLFYLRVKAAVPTPNHPLFPGEVQIKLRQLLAETNKNPSTPEKWIYNIEEALVSLWKHQGYLINITNTAKLCGEQYNRLYALEKEFKALSGLSTSTELPAPTTYIPKPRTTTSIPTITKEQTKNLSVIDELNKKLEHLNLKNISTQETIEMQRKLPEAITQELLQFTHKTKNKLDKAHTLCSIQDGLLPFFEQSPLFQKMKQRIQNDKQERKIIKKNSMT